MKTLDAQKEIEQTLNKVSTHGEQSLLNGVNG
ncbi:hypothetical protein ACUXCC_004868 [Cytobacillus horneckiae]